MKKFTVTTLALLMFYISYSQEVYFEDIEKPSPFNIGIGLGINYGGIGVRATFLPIPKLGLFGAVGYALVGVGYNFGAQFRILPSKRLCPTVAAMYGYNGIIKVAGLDQYDKIYYGASIAGGLQLKSKRNSNYFNFELVVPIRDQAFYDDWDKIRNNPSIEVSSEPLPIAFSIGYHFALE